MAPPSSGGGALGLLDLVALAGFVLIPTWAAKRPRRPPQEAQAGRALQGVNTQRCYIISMGTNRTGTPWKHGFLQALGMSLVLIALTACGGATTSVQTNPAPSAISSVSPACTPSTVAANATS